MQRPILPKPSTATSGGHVVSDSSQDGSGKGIIGEGRQGPIIDVQSIIADYRSQHPENVPRRGRRMKSSGMVSRPVCYVFSELLAQHLKFVCFVLVFLKYSSLSFLSLYCFYHDTLFSKKLDMGGNGENILTITALLRWFHESKKVDYLVSLSVEMVSLPNYLSLVNLVRSTP